MNRGLICLEGGGGGGGEGGDGGCGGIYVASGPATTTTL